MQRKCNALLGTAALAIAGLALAATTASAAPIVEDFESYSVGDVLVPNATGPWATDLPAAANGVVQDDPVASGNNVGFFRRQSGAATAGSYLDLGANSISDGATGEFSVRFLFDQTPNTRFGLSGVPAPGSPTECCAGQLLSVDFYLNRGDLIYVEDQAHSVGTTLATNLNPNTWYTLSASINSDTNTVTDIFLNGDLVSSATFGFNQWALDTTGGDNPLQTFFVYEQGFTAGIYLDDIRVGETAVSAVPAPPAVVLLATGLGLMLVMRTRKRTAGTRHA